jgi:transcriptional regulator with XRE-family HTH domain
MTAPSQYGRKQVARAFGATLRAARLQRGVSQDELGVLCDFDRTYPSLLERGLRSPTLVMVFRLADALRTTPERLVTDTVARLREEATVREPSRR